MGIEGSVPVSKWSSENCVKSSFAFLKDGISNPSNVVPPATSIRSPFAGVNFSTIHIRSSSWVMTRVRIDPSSAPLHFIVLLIHVFALPSGNGSHVLLERLNSMWATPSDMTTIAGRPWRRNRR